MQILFPLRGERLSNLVDFLREFSPVLGGEKNSHPALGKIPSKNQQDLIIFPHGREIKFAQLYHISYFAIRIYFFCLVTNIK